jgi:GMP synthase-like glutamine amidotransferase
MKALIIQHELATTPGSSIEWLQNKHIEFEIIFGSDLTPTLNYENYDFLILCGGSMNVDQEELYPWLRVEKNHIAQFVRSGKRVLGLCLGSQLLAEVLGGSVAQHPFWEVGWQKVNTIDGNELKVFQWHGYSFTPPPNSVVVAHNEACAFQGFSLGENVLAYQFHPETTKEWAEECAIDPEIPPGSQFVQTKNEILNDLFHQIEMQKWFFKQLDSFFKIK